MKRGINALCCFPSPFPTSAIEGPNVIIAIPIPPDPTLPTGPTPCFPSDLRTQMMLPCSTVASLSSHALSPIHAQPVPQVMQISSIRTFGALLVARRRKDVCESPSLVCSSQRMHATFFHAITSDFSFFSRTAQDPKYIVATITYDKHFSSQALLLAIMMSTTIQLGHSPRLDLRVLQLSQRISTLP